MMDDNGFVSMPSTPGADIEINIPTDLLSVKNFESKLEETIIEAALEARNFWETAAGQRLTTSRERYIDAISMTQEGPGQVTLSLSDSFAQKVEKGSSGFDMKPGFLRSPKLKTGPKKMPAAVAKTVISTGAPASKWMIIPLNTNRDAPMGTPGAFRTFTDQQVSGWIHPGFKGVNIREDVVAELRDNILPQRIEKLIDELYGV